MGILLARVVVVVVAAIGALAVGAGSATAAVDAGQVITAEDRLETQILSALNTARRARGLVPLKLSQSLSAAADSHTRSMATHGFFGHESRDGRSVADRVRRSYGLGGRWGVGENLLWSSPSVEASEALEMWMASPGHRRNMLAASWRDIGVAAVSVPAAPGVFSGLDVVIVTTVFGTRTRS